MKRRSKIEVKEVVSSDVAGSIGAEAYDRLGDDPALITPLADPAIDREVRNQLDATYMDKTECP